MIRTIRRHQPDIGACAIGHDVVAATHVGDLLPARPDLRISRILQLKDIPGSEELSVI